MRIDFSTSLIASRQIAQTSKAIQRSLERLSSGKRVNSPRDDVAAYSLALGLDSQIRGLRQASVNINQAAGLVKTADSALSAQQDIVQKMRELAVQGANGALSSADRTAINDQLASLMQEFQKITTSTEFNGIHLLDGSSPNLSFLTGADADDSMEIELPNLQSSSAFEKTVSTGSFVDSNNPTPNYAGGAGNEPNLFADLNQDGFTDFVVGSPGIGGGSVFLGNGDGSFSEGESLSISTSPRFGVSNAGDINGDGLVDLLALAIPTDEIGVFFGNGDGTFSEAETFSSSATASSSSLEDVNNDGNLDIITSNNTDNTISVYLGNGDGSFQDEQTSATSDTANELTFGDFDNDGNLDITFRNSTDLVILLGDGSGSFGSEATLTTGSTGNNLVGDFNRDGNLDIASRHESDENISIYLGNGDGSFAARVTYALPSGNGLAFVQDINADSILDLIVGTGSGDTQVLLGNGDGTFDPYSTAAQNTDGGNLIGTGDANNDGLLDFFYSSSSGLNKSMYTHFGLGTSVTALGDIHVNNEEAAARLLDILDSTVDKLNTDRTSLSTYLNSLEIRLNENLLISESLSDAKSKIEDADFTLEITKLVTQQILQQAQTAALTQANANMQIVLKLLQF